VLARDRVLTDPGPRLEAPVEDGRAQLLGDALDEGASRLQAPILSL
jgi:hypothetical protein